MSCSDLFLGLIAILFPPIAVWIKTGLCSCDSLLNILLCMLGYIPGLIHAWYIIAKFPEHDYDRIDGDVESQGRVTYYYVSHEPAGRQGRRQNQGTQGYGTVPAVPGNKPMPRGVRQQPQHQSPQQPQRQSQQSGIARTHDVPSGSRPGASSAADSNDQGAPPPYSDVVRGDHKIQSQD